MIFIIISVCAIVIVGDLEEILVVWDLVDLYIKIWVIWFGGWLIEEVIELFRLTVGWVLYDFYGGVLFADEFEGREVGLLLILNIFWSVLSVIRELFGWIYIIYLFVLVCIYDIFIVILIQINIFFTIL